METILNDEDVVELLSAADAVAWMGEAVDAHHRGELLAPPRVHTDFGAGRLVFTTGRLRGSWFGYRSYDSFGADPGAQMVVVHDEASGRVRAVAVGNEFGPRRVGAIGGVAAGALAAPDAHVAAVIGTGTQAYTQMWALAAIRDIREVRVFSRDPQRRSAFVERIRTLVAGTVRTALDARSACEGAEIVVLATSSPIPVIEAAWIGRGAYVTTLGPKQQGRAEFGLDLAEAASLLVTDSVDQIGAYDPPNILAGPPTGTGSSRSAPSAPAKLELLPAMASRCSSRSVSAGPRFSCSTGSPPPSGRGRRDRLGRCASSTTSGRPRTATGSMRGTSTG